SPDFPYTISRKGEQFPTAHLNPPPASSVLKLIMDDFQALSDRYLQWFKAAGGEFRDDLLQIVDLRPQAAGRGIIATRDIPEETTLFTIPRQAIINVLTSELPQKLPQVFDGSIDEMDDNAEPLDSWGQLILVMLYEVLQGDASRWRPYFDILPQQFDTPIFWSDGELLELQGSTRPPSRRTRSCWPRRTSPPAGGWLWW
ncbi:hypothetical protein BN1723_008156, partial [Verticillium longisporum]